MDYRLKRQGILRFFPQLTLRFPELLNSFPSQFQVR
jgi:hypothetical protein